jgi:molecular chaperone GrpE
MSEQDRSESPESPDISAGPAAQESPDSPDGQAGQDPSENPAPGPGGEAGPQGFDADPERAAADLAAVEAEVEAAGEAVEADIFTVTAERDEYRDTLIRLQADFENYKKRVAKQSEDLRERAAETLVGKLLPVLDTAELAIAHGGGEDVAQLCAALFAALEKEGLERIDKPGEPFDPNCHDAVAHEPGDGTQEVAEVMRSGYRWRGRVLRPAMVKVRG